MSWQTSLCDFRTGITEYARSQIVTYHAEPILNELAGKTGLFYRVADVREFENECERVEYSDFPLNLYKIDDHNIYLEL